MTGLTADDPSEGLMAFGRSPSTPSARKTCQRRQAAGFDIPVSRRHSRNVFDRWLEQPVHRRSTSLFDRQDAEISRMSI